MDTSRFVITDHQRERMEAHCSGRKKDLGRTGSDPGMFLEAVLWGKSSSLLCLMP